MRLICPNCGAQYEVDAMLIPVDGRDVQCSSCGHTWFQTREGAETGLADEMGVTKPATAKQADRPEREEAEAEADADASGPAEPPLPEARKPLDDTTRSILKEEAEREAAQRRRDRAGALESQPDLGLDQPTGAPHAAPTDPADAPAPEAASPPEAEPVLREPEEPTAHAPTEEPGPAEAGSRRDLLPDIEEINSTLTAAPEGAATAEAAAPRDARGDPASRRGFRFGFGLVVGITAVLLLLYAFAPRLAQAVPATEAPLAAYVNWANDVREGLDTMLQRLVAVIDGATEGS